MKTSSGFTLIELMTVIVVFAILATVATPSYRVFIETQAVRGASYDLMTSLVYARSEAIKRNAIVSVNQAAGGWTRGWTVSAGAATLRTQDPFLAGVTVTNSASLATITYANDGRLSGATGDFTIASTDGAAARAAPGPERLVAAKPAVSFPLLAACFPCRQPTRRPSSPPPARSGW